MQRTRRHPALAGRLTAAALTAAVLTACGGEESSGGAEGPEPSTEPSAAAPDDGTAAAYLEAPDGVELTEPGTELALGDAATAAWTPRQDLVAVVEVAVTAVERADVERDFAGYELDERSRTATPYFVRAEVTNAGDVDLGERRLPLYLVDDGGRLVEPSPVDEGAGSFRPCPRGVLPAIFAPEDTAETCLVFLVPRGATYAQVMFRPPEGVVPLTWSGTATAYQPPRRERPRRDRGDRPGGGQPS